MANLYSEGQKAIAIEILSRNNNEITRVTLDEIRIALNLPKLPKVTVWRWLHEPEKPVKKAVVVRSSTQVMARKALDEMFEETARLYLSHAQKQIVIDKTTGQQAVIAAATAVDKMRLLRDLPTEIVGILPGLIEAARKRNIDPAQIIEGAIAELESGNDGA